MGIAESHVEVLRHLDADETRAVTLLAERATEADGVRPLSEHSALHLRHGGDEGIRHLLVYAPAGNRRPRLVGYAHLDVTDRVAGSSAEIVVDPDSRRQGVGRRLVDLARGETPDGRLRLWAHGETSAAVGLARTLGYRKVRELLQLRRSLSAPLPDPRVPDGVTVRTFTVDDAADWVALNALIFADHPEQGALTLPDLQRRMAEPWFDPDGFFLAMRGEEPVGYHWTKVHGGHDHPHHDGTPPPQHEHEHGHELIGEVYVVGVHPSEQGTGLGRALILTGLHHLRSRGLLDVMLYVDAGNAPAIRAYERLGFTHWDSDVQFRSPDAPSD